MVDAQGGGDGEVHAGGREGWLRAAVLGADDGVVSTASVILGVAASNASRSTILLAGVASLVAGAMSMAAGEYVSVSAQRDSEEADVAKERSELDANPAAELHELARIYERRGLDPDLARRVADQLSAYDRLESHLRDELGINERTRARPLQAALVSAVSFASLALLPIAAVILAPASLRALVTCVVSLVSLAFLGALGGHLAGAPRSRAAVRVCIGGGLAMLATSLIGRLLGVAGL